MKSCAEGRFSVGEAARMGAMAIASGRAGFSNQILRRPRGVIFCISPWNFPISTPMRKICPALAFGNAVVMKPSQFTPATNFLLAQIAEEFFPQNLIPAQLELGDKNGAILNDSDNLESAITQIMGAAFMTSGQGCTAISRVIVHKDLAAEAKDLLAAKAQAMRVGPGLEDRQP